MTYVYETLKKGERQYDDYDLRETNCVRARYIKSCCDIDNGNPYIEALPLPRDKNEVHWAYSKPLSSFDRQTIKTMTNLQKQISVASLRNLRYELPFHAVLEEEFYLSLVNSYRNRRIKIYPYDEIAVTQNDCETKNNAVLLGQSASAANAGCTLIGYSGCGKSSALEILLSNYPQVIEHISPEIPRFTQIVYLTIVCPTNSNFSALYASIGAEIDLALGNINPIYERMIEKEKTLANKARIVCKLIELFGIGCIIFDEIQLIDFEGQRENTFESLLTIVNKTKVALIAVGTQDAYEKMFPNLRMSRRTGTFIEAHRYCNSRMYFNSIVKNLMQYQWFDEYIEPNQEICDALYAVTKGIVDQLIGVYMYMQIDYLRFQNNTKIDSKYIYRIAEKYFPGMKGLLENIKIPETEARRQSLLREAQHQLDQMIQYAKAEEALQELSERINSSNEKIFEITRSNVIRDVSKTISVTGEVYNQSRIEHAVDHVLQNGNNANCTEEQLASKAYQWLRKSSSDRRTTQKTKSKLDAKHIVMSDLLKECT